MARIRIEDLPPDTDLTPEELERIFGAGRPSFRPTVEGLENREMYAANLGTALTPGLLPTANLAQDQAQVRTYTPATQIQMGPTASSTVQWAPAAPGQNPALDHALWGNIRPGAQASLQGNLLANQNKLLLKQGPGQQKVGVVNPLLAPKNLTKEQVDSILRANYEQWKKTFVTDKAAGVNPLPPGQLRVKDPQSGDDTVSEGIGYGMLLAVQNGDRATFDGLWAYAKAHMNKNGLMDWRFGADGKLKEAGAATDADEDMAAALIMAFKKWGADSYKEDAKTLIKNILKYEIDPDTYDVLPGDSWGANGKTHLNPSYFAPAYYKLFSDFTGDRTWDKVRTRVYVLLKMMQAKPGNVGLMPDWMDQEGNPAAPIPGGRQDFPYLYSYDAMRTPLRIALDAVWYNNPDAIAVLSKFSKFFKGVGATNIKDKYNLNGTDPGNSWHNAAGVSMAATSAILLDDNDPDRQSFWNETLRNYNDPTRYYNETLRSLSLLLIGGHMNKPPV
jgi:endo-1,4-beta-D-glucanase Y